MKQIVITMVFDNEGKIRNKHYISGVANGYAHENLVLDTQQLIKALEEIVDEAKK